MNNLTEPTVVLGQDGNDGNETATVLDCQVLAEFRIVTSKKEDYF
jgi:hypothetical protein